MIELKSLRFSYGERTILDGVSSVFSPGIFYGIVGPNGCGKTTLMRLLCGLEQPDRGELLLEGVPYASYGGKEFARRVSLLPQMRVLPSVSVEDLVFRGRYPHGNGRSEEDRNAVCRALRVAGVEDLAGRDVNLLSGGERQKVCLAMLLAQDTPYVFLDEPTTYLDISHRFTLMEQMQTLRDEGRCVVAVLHDLSLALRYCDRILVLQEGKLYPFDSPKDLIRSGLPERLFSVSCREIFVDGRTEYLFLPAK